MDPNDRAGQGDTQRRFRLLLPRTQIALSRNGFWTDVAIANLSDSDLRRLAYIGPLTLQDIRQHFPRPEAG